MRDTLRCPQRHLHADQVYGDRYSKRPGGMTRYGAVDYAYIDGVRASQSHAQRRCDGCDLYVIWTAR